MRTKRQRVFDITINGLSGWREDAGNRSLIERQHDLSVEHVGKYVRVLEKYIGGARGVQKDEGATDE